MSTTPDHFPTEVAGLILGPSERVVVDVLFDQAGALVAQAGGGHDHEGHGHEGHDHAAAGGIEWEDDMVEVNRMTTPANMRWKLIDRETGAENAAIDWQFRVGDRVKIRLLNEMATIPCTTPSTSMAPAASWS
jgi:hypothetical protein